MPPMLTSVTQPALMPSSTARLTARARADGRPASLADHVSCHGRLLPVGQREAPTTRELLEQVAIAGRGGAGFPLWRKIQSMGKGRRIVVVNGSEGEPAIWKDRLLLSRHPHLVLDGAVLAAEVVNAVAIHVVVSAGCPAAAEAVRQAIAERKAAHYDRLPFTLTLVEDRFVAGEASAVVGRIDGGTSVPRFTTVRTSERGVSGRPTLLSNAETFAQLAVLVHGGLEAFTSLGTSEEPGTMLFTVRGAVAKHSVIEMPIGSRVGDVVAAAGGATEPIAAVLTGGYHGRWVSAHSAWWQPASRGGLEQIGGALGAGLLLCLPVSVCPLGECARVVRYLADQIAGQCGPCVNGLPAIARTVEDLAQGRALRADLDNLFRWCGLVEGRGLCRHPDGTVAFVRSMIEVFAADVELHLSGHCGRPTTGVLPVSAV